MKKHQINQLSKMFTIINNAIQVYELNYSIYYELKTENEKSLIEQKLFKENNNPLFNREFHDSLLEERGILERDMHQTFTQISTMRTIRQEMESQHKALTKEQ